MLRSRRLTPPRLICLFVSLFLCLCECVSSMYVWRLQRTLYEFLYLRVCACTHVPQHPIHVRTSLPSREPVAEASRARPSPSERGMPYVGRLVLFRLLTSPALPAAAPSTRLRHGGTTPLRLVLRLYPRRVVARFVSCAVHHISNRNNRSAMFYRIEECMSGSPALTSRPWRHIHRAYGPFVYT